MADRVQQPNNAEVESNSDGNGSRKLYSCKSCDSQFFSFQALGGHQNAHKTERVGQLHAQQAMQSQQYNAHILPYSRQQCMSFPCHFNGNPLLNDNNHLRSKSPNQSLVIPNHGYNQNTTQPMVNPKAVKPVLRLFGVPLSPVFTDGGTSKKLCSGKRKCIEEEEEAGEESLKHHIDGSSSAKKHKSQTETGKNILQVGEELMNLKKDTCHQFDEEFIEWKKKIDNKVESSMNEDNKGAQESGKMAEENVEIIKWKKNSCSQIDGSFSNEVQNNIFEKGKDSLYNEDGDMKSIGQLGGSSSAILNQKDAPKDETDYEAYLKWKKNLNFQVDGSSFGENSKVSYDHNSVKGDKGEGLDLDLHL